MVISRKEIKEEKLKLKNIKKLDRRKLKAWVILVNRLETKALSNHEMK
jgi:hypothetical protein